MTDRSPQHPGQTEGDPRPSPQDEFLSRRADAARLRFAPALAVLSALILSVLFLRPIWLTAFAPRLDQVSSPERALDLMVGRTMDLEEALRQVPAWERRVYRVTMWETANERAQAISWYEELAAYSSDPMVQLHLAILQAEAGGLDRIQEKAAVWERDDEPFPSFARLLRAAYLGPPDPAARPAILHDLDAVLSAGWFHDRLAIQWASRAGDHSLLAVANQTVATRAQPLLLRLRGLVGLELAVMVIGLLALGHILRRVQEPGTLRLGTTPVPPPWDGKVGAAVLLHGGAIQALLAFGLARGSSWLGEESPLYDVMAWPWSSLFFLPLLLFAYRHLMRPVGLQFTEGLGLRLADGPRGLARLILTLLALGLLGEWGLSFVGEWLGWPGHWVESFDGDLAWGTPFTLVTSLVDDVILAPFFEEVVFRGLLFAALRRRFGFAASAVLSAAIFALGHGYGAVGSLSVFWSGLLWAWAYEKTKSLLPAMGAHAAGNLMVALEVLGLFR